MNISTTQNPEWLSVYLYRAEPFHPFLTGAIHPFVEKLRTESLIEKYFFIRYYDRGPHIRLRLLANRERISQLTRMTGDYFVNYMNEQPSVRIDPPMIVNLAGDGKWLPNDTVHFVPYEREIIRYGGDTGILIAENQFEASADAVMSALLENPEWTYQDALTKAIQLHLGFAAAMRMDVAYAKGFFTNMYSNWSPMSEKMLTNSNGTTSVQAYHEAFSRQKESLLGFVSDVWDGLQNNCDFEEEWFNQWLRRMDKVYDNLCEARRNEVLGGVRPLLPADVHLFRHYLHDQYFIFDSYIHMTNNRLGISNHDEGYLGYLIAGCLSLMMGDEVSLATPAKSSALLQLHPA